MKNTLPSTKTEKNAKREIDWQAIYARIASTKLLLGNVGQSSEAERERIWGERARQFAQVVEEDASGDAIHLVIVKLGRELCAFDVNCVESIRPIEQITRVPHAPDWIYGVSNLRGQIYSVTDLQRFLHLNNGQDSSAEGGEIVLVKLESFSLALRVDRVASVETMPETRIRASTDTIHGVKPEYIRGVIEDYGDDKDKTPVLVLDMNALLSDERMLVREEFA